MHWFWALFVICLICFGRPAVAAAIWSFVGVTIMLALPVLWITFHGGSFSDALTWTAGAILVLYFIARAIIWL